MPENIDINKIEEINISNAEKFLFISYDLRPEEVIAGLTLFQKEFLFKKNIIYTIIFSVILIIFSIDAGTGSSGNIVPFVCIGACLGMIWLVWSFPKRHRRAMAEGIREACSNFTMRIFDDAIEIPAISEKDYRYPLGSLKIIESSELFVMSFGKETVYIIPKRCLDENQIERMNSIFRGFDYVDRII